MPENKDQNNSQYGHFSRSFYEAMRYVWEDKVMKKLDPFGEKAPFSYI